MKTSKPLKAHHTLKPAPKKVRKTVLDVFKDPQNAAGYKAVLLFRDHVGQNHLSVANILITGTRLDETDMDANGITRLRECLTPHRTGWKTLPKAVKKTLIREACLTA